MKFYVFLLEQKWILTELRYINVLGIVGALGMFFEALQAKISTIFISRTSGTDIENAESALYFGQVIVSLTSYVVAQGIAGGMGALCSQAFGAQNYKLMGTYFMRGLVISSLTCLPVCAFWLSAKSFILLITQNEELAQGAGDYCTILCFSFPAYIYSRMVCSFLQSQNIVFPILAIEVCGNLLNICLQCVFVVVLSLEIKGAAVSYAISTYLITILFFAYTRFTSSHLTYSMFSWSYLAEWWHFMEYDMLGVLQLLIINFATRLIPIILIGLILKDTNQLALMGILNVVWFLFFSIAFGFGIGAGVRIGNLLGENNFTRAKKSIVLLLSFSVIAQGFLQIVFFSFSHYISDLFTSIPEFRKQIETGLKIISIGILSDVNFVSSYISNASCLQKSSLIGQFLIMTIFAVLGCVLVYFVPWRAPGFYMMISIGQIVCFLYQILLLYFSNWEKIAGKVSRNTNANNQIKFGDENSFSFPRLKKIFLFSRYVIILIIELIIFLLLGLFSYFYFAK